MDCEGCEAAALRGLTLPRRRHQQGINSSSGSSSSNDGAVGGGVSVGVFLVEKPGCEILHRLAIDHNYIILPLYETLDTVFVSPRMARRMKLAPNYNAQSKAPGGGGGRSNQEKKIESMRQCPQAARYEGKIWRDGDPWPPSFRS